MLSRLLLTVVWVVCVNGSLSSGVNSVGENAKVRIPTAMCDKVRSLGTGKWIQFSRAHTHPLQYAVL